jgi:hypothetical protein
VNIVALLEDLFLSVERQMIGIFTDDDVNHKAVF